VVEHLPLHPKVDGLGLAAVDDNEKEKRDKNGFKIAWPAMVGHLPHHLRVVGLSPAAATDTG
jgi:hypothetical protein